ncbi:MAG: ParB/RepB/Spo0J family partition protein [Deltaproteobacteria bacterium]|nr:ParB/RepB/Spo0J family partition protein [Deltaproteobacteria bacterium]
MNTGQQDFIRLADIDWSDSVCLITYGAPPASLALSIETIGVVHSPVVQRKKSGLYRIVCGSRRLAICKKNGLDALRCSLLPEELSRQSCLRIAVFENAAARELNPVEKFLALSKTAGYVSRDELIDIYMPLLSLEPSEVMLGRYLSLAAVEAAVLDAVATYSLHERTAFALAGLRPQDRHSLFQLFKELPFSASVAEEIIQLASEIALRDGSTIAAVIDSEDIRQLRLQTNRPARQRAGDIRLYLQEKRSPRLSSRKKRFAAEVRNLGLPSGVKLAPPPFFEGPRWRLECTFGHPADLVDKLQQVIRLAGSHDLAKVMQSGP